MRSSFWTAATIVLGVFGVFLVRTVTADKAVHALEVPVSANEAEMSEDETDEGYTDREMIEYRHRANMPRHWRHVVIGQ